MADGTVDMKFTGSAQDLERAIDGLEKKYEKLTGQIKAGTTAAKAQANSLKAAQAQVAKWGNNIAQVVAGYASVTAGIGAAISLQKQLIADSDKYADSLDSISRKFQVQAGLTALQSEKAKKSLADIAIRNAVTVAAATDVGTQLASGGFTPQDAAGAANEAVLRTMAATGAAGGDAGAFAKTMTQAASAFGIPRTAAGLKRVGLMMSGSYKSGDFQASDMEQIAPKVQGLVGLGVAPEDIMAMFNIERSVTGADVASTALKGMGEAHAGARRLPGEKISKKEKLLQMIGLKSEDVDFIGEGFEEIRTKMNAGMAKLKPEERQSWMQRFYGKEFASSVTGLFARGGEFGKLRAAQFDEKQFDKDVAIAQGGRAAGRVRTDEQMMLETARLATDETLLFDQFEMEQRRRGASWIASKAGRGVANIGRAFGASPRFALESMGGDKSLGGGAYEAALERTSNALGGQTPTGISKADAEYLAELKRGNDLLEKNNALMEQQQGKNAKRPVAVKPDE